MKHPFLFLALEALTFSICMKAKAQDTRAITLPGGAQYKASEWKQLWWGHHYRKEWLAPVAFPYLDWNHTKGGLHPLKRGGGHETKTLRVLGGDGKEYVLRSMDKDLTLKVPPELRGTYLNDVANDQISTAHPYGPLVVAQLAAWAGLLHTNPTFYYVPFYQKDTAFNGEFAGTICMFEEHPSGRGWQHTSLTENADVVVNTEKMLQQVCANNKYQVDQTAFLKVRLFDVLINDWDRHDDQWVWAANHIDGTIVYKPFARDRDQAFSKTDGINLFFLSRPWAIRSLQNFNGHIKDIIGQNLSALALDHQFLNALSKQDWEQTARELQQQLTDSAIHAAVMSLPDTIFSLSGAYLEQQLQQRRNLLVQDALRYYRFLSKEVELIGSDKGELFLIDRTVPHQAQVTIQQRKSDGTAGAIIYRRIFHQGETRHINLYGLAGEDTYRVVGTGKSFMSFRIIDRDGSEPIDIRSNTLSTQKRINLYVGGQKINTANPTFKTFVLHDSSSFTYNRQAFKPDWHQLLVLPTYNADDGLLISLGYTYKKWGWMKPPYAWRQHLGASIALGTGAPSFTYDGRFTKAFGTWDFGTSAVYNGPLYLFDFYGLGNETNLTVRSRAYYRVHAQEILVDPYVAKTFRYSEVRFGLHYQAVSLRDNVNRYIHAEQDKLDPKIFSLLQFGGIWGNYTVQRTNNVLYPSRGYGWMSSIAWVRELNKGKNEFIKLGGAVYTYVPLGPLVVALRAGVSTLTSNQYQFYQASTLGGHNNLRGYWRDRFAGRTAFYQNTELRYKVADAKGYIFRGAYGLYGFLDNGRVWLPEEHSIKWHTGYGGGLFIIPYNLIAFTASYGRSEEVSTLTVKVGFFF